MVQARAGGGGVNWAVGAKAAVTQGIGCGAQARQGLSQGSGVAAVGAPGGGNDGSCWLGRAQLLEARLSEG